MPIHRCCWALAEAAATISLAVIMPLAAFAAPPTLETLMPLAGKAGASQEVALLGPKPGSVTALLFSHPDIHATAGKEAGQWTIDIGQDAPPGDYDVWAVGADGMSAPRRYVVSELAESAEQAKNDLPESGQAINVPAAVTGRIDPATDRDCFRFQLALGQRVTIECRSASLDGTVLPALSLLGPNGEELLHDDGRQREPLLHFVAPAEGEYVARVEERAYRKGANNVYRLVISDRPRLAAAFPSAVVRGEKQTVALYDTATLAKNCEARALEVVIPAETTSVGGMATATSALMDHFDYRQAAYEGSVRFELVDRPPRVEQEEFANHRQEARPLTLPATIAGRFLVRNDVDWFRFSAKKDQNLWIEAVAERSGRSLDLEIVIHDAKGKVLQTLADTVQPKELPPQLSVATLDPQDQFKPPADGDYFLAVRDLLGPHMAGPDRAYLLHIGPPREQVAVVAMPAAAGQGLSVAAGKKVTLDLIAIRRGGHQAAVHVKASGLPDGVTADDVVLAAKKPAAVMTLVASENAVAWSGPIELTAETELDGQPHSFQVKSATTIHAGVPSSARMTQILPLVVLPPAKKK